MKKTLLLLATTSLMLGQISCKKENKGQPVDTYSKMSAKINGVVWNTGAGARFEKDNNGRFSIEMNTYDKDNLWLYGLAVSRINLSLNTQTLRPTSNSLDKSLCVALFSDGVADAIYDFYDVNETDSASNQFVIDSYDTKAKIVTGTFNVLLYRTGNLAKPALYGFPDTLRITEGKFNAIIHDYPNN